MELCTCVISWYRYLTTCTIGVYTTARSIHEKKSTCYVLQTCMRTHTWSRPKTAAAWGRYTYAQWLCISTVAQCNDLVSFAIYWWKESISIQQTRICGTELHHIICVPVFDDLTNVLHVYPILYSIRYVQIRRKFQFYHDFRYPYHDIFK